jgi:hypothetical protein
MSEVYTCRQGEKEKSSDLLSMLIQGLRAASFGRSKPTSLGWDVVMEPGMACARKPERHEHGIDAIAHMGKLSVELDPNDPDPSGTCKLLKMASDGEISKREIAEFSLPDLKAMYAPDLDIYKDLNRRIIESMGLPASFLEPVKKTGGIGRYYSESIWPGYYSFEET